MRSRLFSFAPSLRIDAQLEMLTQEVLAAGTTAVLRYTYTLLNRTPAP